jgi:ankyrin repeat protein
MLLDRGIDVNARQYVGTTAAMIAAANGDSKIVDFLFSKQADPNLADQHADTPLTEQPGREVLLKARFVASWGS